LENRYILCGIVAAYNVKNAPSLALSLVVEQKSRGSDGTGIGFLFDGRCVIVKKSITPEQYNSAFKKRIRKIKATIAIGHNRAATCNLAERDQDKESHPFRSEKGDFMLIHNGILRDFEKLRGAMIRVYGHNFSSGVDSEIFVHLLEDLLIRSNDRYSALEKFYPLSQGNILILFSDGELIGIPDSAFYLLTIGEKVFVASELSTLSSITEIIAKDSEECILYSPPSATGSMVSVKMNNGNPVIRFVGRWDKEIVKEGTWIGTNRVMCDFCKTSRLVMRFKSKEHNGRTLDKCLDCFRENKKLPISTPVISTGYTSHRRRRFPSLREDNERNESVRCQCSLCNKWYSFNEIVVCTDCNEFMCIICFMDINHRCKSANIARQRMGNISPKEGYSEEDINVMAVYPWYVPAPNRLIAS